jgi:uncharacterized membrane protein HdeD (DUF308 family)
MARAPRCLTPKEEFPVNETLLRSWWVPGLRGAIAVACGLLMLLCEGLTQVWLAALFSAHAALGGTVWALGALRNRRADARWRTPMLLGVLSIGVGLLSLTLPAPTALVLVLLIGSHALVTGLLDFVSALRLRKFIRGERLLALSALASIGFGAALFVAPHSGAFVLEGVVGLYALASGLPLLALALRVRAWSLINTARSSPAAGIA